MLNRIDMMLLTIKALFQEKIREERGDVNVVAIVVLIAVAVVLAVLLKDSLSTLITNLIGQITSKTGEIFN